jgi:hypothetical protein
MGSLTLINTLDPKLVTYSTSYCHQNAVTQNYPLVPWGFRPLTLEGKILPFNVLVNLAGNSRKIWHCFWRLCPVAMAKEMPPCHCHNSGIPALGVATDEPGKAYVSLIPCHSSTFPNPAEENVSLLQVNFGVRPSSLECQYCHLLDNSLYLVWAWLF